MQSNGGLTEAHRSGARTRSCPGRPAASSAWPAPPRRPGFGRVIGFDMGGTSTDVSHFAGEFERQFETQVAGVRMRAPMLSIHTVAAGGGSVLHFDGSRYRVGPGLGRGGPRPGRLPPRRPAGRHRRQRHARPDPAGALPRACSAPAATEPLDAGGRARRSSPRSADRRSAAADRPAAAGRRRRWPRASSRSPWRTWPTRSRRSRCSAATT